MPTLKLAPPPKPPKPSHRTKPKAAPASKTPGVYVTKLDPHPQTGAERHRVRWTDPETRKPAERTMTGIPRVDVDRWATQQSVRLLAAKAKRDRDAVRAEIAGIDPRAKPAVRRRIEDAARAYVRDLAESTTRSPKTLRHANVYCTEFVGWCAGRGIAFLDELTIEDLESYRAALRTMRQPNGKPYMVSSSNSQQSPIKAMLNREHKRGRAPHLSPAFVGEALKHAKPTDAEHARALDVDEIHACLRAAMAWDWRYRTAKIDACHQRRCLAIDIAMLLLGGFRLQEYTFTPCSAADVDEAEDAVIHVIGKGSKGEPRPRAVFMRGFTTIGTELMCELKRGRSASEWLSEHDYGAIQNTLPLLARFGAPEVTAHDCRATCATYQCGVKDLDDSRRCNRLGHGIVIAHSVYRQPPKGMAFGADSIEDAMCAAGLFRAVVEHYRLWRESFGAPRTRKRRVKAPGHSGALLMNDPHAVRDALNPHPAKRHARLRLPVPTNVKA